MNMQFEITRQVRHQVTVPAREFFLLWGKFFGRSDCPELVFGKGKVLVDEGLDVVDGRVSMCSSAGGVISWNEDDGEYMHWLHNGRTDLGAFVGAVFTLDDELRAAFETLASLVSQKETAMSDEPILERELRAELRPIADDPLSMMATLCDAMKRLELAVESSAPPDRVKQGHLEACKARRKQVEKSILSSSVPDHGW